MKLQKHAALFMILLVALVAGVCRSAGAATLEADYQFNNTRASSVGVAPDLTDVGAGTNSFATEPVDGGTFPVLTFPQNNGLQISPTTNTISSGSYSVVVLFRFNDVSSYKRIIDFKNGTSDRGLYNYNGKLHFYSSATGNTTAIAAGTYVQVVLTRDALKNVVGYLNGVQEFSFADTSDDAVIDAANTLRFFKDDGGESSAGAVARIRLFDGALSANEVAALDGTPGGGGGGAANLRADYQLQSTYASSVGTPPNLSNITQTGNAANAFITTTVDGTTRTVLGFPQGNGVMLSGATGVVSSTSYSIVLLCRLTDITGYRRLIDVTDGTSGDIGFYNYSGNFQHFTGGSGTSTPITPNAWVQVVCTRDAAGNVAGYVNGAPQFAFVDNAGNALIDNAVRFFNNQSGGYESAGEIARIRFYDGALTAAEVAALDRLPGANTPSLFINDVTLNEGSGGSATFTVSLSPSSQQTITVNYATANGTAVAPGDYTTKTGTLTFAPGITTQTVTVAVVGDTALEADETFNVNLSNAGATLIIDAQGVGTIVNDDQLPTLSLNNVSVAEGNAGTQILNFPVTLSAASAQTVTVQYATANGTANAGDDFVDKTGTLTFAPGVTSQNVAITINGDTNVEPDEDFTINLTAPTNAAIADAQGIGIIVNDDGGTLQFSTSVYSVSEAGALATISVTRTSGSSGAVSVDYATSNGTASAPGDYTAKTGTLNWADGDTGVKTFTVPIINDGVTEPNETINLTLSNATGGAVLGIPKTATLTIIDANPAGLLQFSAPTYSVNESGPTATISVTRTGGSTGAISVTYATANATGNGSATAGSDYSAKTGTLNWAAGDTTAKTFTVAITQDTVVEGPETLNLALSSPTNGATLDNVKNTAILTIVDDEPLPTITVNNAVVDEGDTGTTPMTFTFTLSGPVTQNVLVDFKTGDTNPISATAGNDYTARRGTLTFPANTLMQTVVVQINGDTYREPDERFTMNLSKGVNVNLTGAGAKTQGIATISNDDANPRPSIVGGPVVLMGVDTEDGGVGGHGPIDSFVSVVNSILRNMTNDGQRILVIGGGKDAGDNPTTFWNEISLDTGQGVTYVNGAANISAQSFAGFAMIAVVSSEGQVGGGISQAENDALAARRTDVANFVNSGGGLLGFSQDGLGNPYNYIDRLGVFTVKTGLGYSAITPTAEGAAIGITKEITGPWHDEYLTFPNFLSVLATNDEDGKAAAIGGKLVTIGTTLRVNDVNVAEGDAGTKTLTFTVTLSAPTADPVTVNYATANGVAANNIGAATAGSDYVAKTGTLTFAPNGPLTQAVAVTINGDTITEPDEIFVLNLSNATGATIGDDQGIGTITNDDNVQAGSLQFSSPTYSVSESGPVATLSVTRTGGTGVAVGVSYATSNGTAVAPGDYTTKTGTLSWAIGDGAAKTIAVPIIDDALIEGNETFKVTLSAPTGGALIGTPNQAIVTIADNDSPPPPADGGPLILMGIDAEDGGPGSHGPIANYVAVVNSILGKVANGGQGILVIGGGKNASDDVTAFWNAIAAGTGKPVTYVNGATNISARSFAGFAMIAVVSSAAETSSGGLTQAENDALATRRTDVATFVNTGGGLLGFSQSGFTTPYPYIEGFGVFTFNTELSYTDITPTPAGQAIGITDALDVIAWHDEYLTFPAFLGILATNTASGKPAAIGGASVVIGNAIRINDVSTIEGNPPSGGAPGTKTLSFTATLSQASTQTITVNYATANGITNPATAGSDYVAKTGTLTFAPGVTTRPVAITINGDTIVEPNETFFVNLSNPVNATISDARGIGTITNDDTATAGTLQFSVTAYTVAESSDTATITVTRTGGSTGAIGVTYATSNGTATSGSDYVAKTGTLSWATGDSASKTFTIQILNDTVAETDETINLALSLPTGGATLGTPGAAQLTILDNDSAPVCSNVFTDSTLEAAAPNPAWTIQTSTAFGTPICDGACGDGGGAAGPQSGIKWAWFGGTDAAEISTLGRSVTLPAGASVTLKFAMRVAVAAPFTDVLRVKVDGTTVKTYTEPGATESGYSLRTVDLSAYANGASHTIVFEYSGVGGTSNIANFNVDNIELEVCSSTATPKSLSINDVSVLEGSSVNFTVTLSASSTQNVSVQYVTSNGSAGAPGDYTSKTGTLTILAGQTKGTINIVTIGDTLDELDETFFVNLSAPNGATISDTQGRANIIDNDSAPSVTINDVTVTEGDSGTKNATFTINLSAASGQTVTINAIPSNGTARTPADYVTGGARLIFAPGETSKTFSVPVKGDLLDELDETFFVLLSQPVNCSVSRARATGTITDNDAAPSISIDDVRIGEGNAGQRTAAFRLKLSAPSGQIVKISYATANGTATAGVDYVAVPATQIAFTVGNLYAYARVLINGDALNEPDESFFVNLSSPLNATIADRQALGTILNDDSAPSLSINDVSISEGNAGTKNLTFTVTLSKISGQTVTVNFATADGVAKAGSDYVAKSGLLTFAAGQTTKTISVPITGETLIEGNETFFVFLSAATNASIGRARAIGTINNDDTSQ